MQTHEYVEQTIDANKIGIALMLFCFSMSEGCVMASDRDDHCCLSIERL